MGMDKIDKQLDILWSKLVKKRANNKCEKCNGTKKLHSHHILTRKAFPSLRYDLRNGVCLCENCHTVSNESAHKNISAFKIWIDLLRGNNYYIELKQLGNKPQKSDKKELLTFYQNVDSEI